MNFTGLYLALFTLAAIGLGFLWVIKLEYHVGAHVDKAVFVIGCLVTTGSLFAPSPFLSALIGILGGTVIWGATELKDQEKRVKAGMFKSNPKKHHGSNLP
jgi:hypothetical protein